MPLPTPTIRIRLTGLLVFYFKKDSGGSGSLIECNIGVHDKSNDHQLRIIVHDSTPPNTGRVDSNVILELSKPLKGFPISLIVDNPDPIAPGIITYPQSTGPFSVPASIDESPFDLIPDIEGPDFHNAPLPRAFVQFIRLNNGVFYTMFHKPGWIIRENGGVARFRDFAIDLGVNIYLKDTEDSKATLTYGSPEKKVEFKKKTGTVYEIEVLNDCPVPVGGDADVFESDFKLYYNVLVVPNPDDRFSVVYRKKQGGHPLDRDHPCGIIKGGQSGG